MSRSKGRVSKALVHACAQNRHSHIILQKDLSLLDKQKAQKVKTMQENIAKIELRDPDRPLSSLNPPLVSGRARSASPRAEYSSAGRGFLDCYRGSVRPCSSSPSSRSGSASPKRRNTRPSLTSSPLLPRRRANSAVPASSVSRHRSSLPVDVKVTLLNGKILKASSAVNKQSSHELPQNVHLNVPEIIVSDQTEDEQLNFGFQKKGSSPRTSSSGSPSSASDSGSEHENSPPPSLLSPHIKRHRSNSMPMIVPPSASRPSSPRPSEPFPSSPFPHARSSPRDASPGFSGIVPARRRGSIPERWGSISERVRSTTSRGRRGSADMDRLLRDLRYGVLNKELMRAAAESRSPTAPSRGLLWEDMKECRYLRIPSRYASDEEVCCNSD